MKRTYYHFKAIAVLYVFLLSTSNSDVLAQCDAGLNDTICLGESSLLIATGGGDYKWSTGATSDSITVTPTKTTTYYVTVTGRTGNLICNGDFELGDTCFTSAYGPPSLLYVPYGYNVLNQGDYGVTPNSGPVFDPWFDNCFDHTNPPTGKMMCIDGATVANTPVWEQTINVTPGTNYDFSAWVQTVAPGNPARLQFRINGTLIGPVFNALAVTCSWQNFFVTWNSGVGVTKANIRIDNQNIKANGNDFALDDITFSTLINCVDSVTIVVNPLPTISAGADAGVCMGDSTILTASGGIKYNWSTGDSINPITVSPLIATTYTVFASDSNGCTGTDEVVVSINPNPTANAGIDTAICIGETASLIASGGSTYKWSTAETSSNIIVKPNIITTYTVTVSNSFNCTDSDNVIITVNPYPIVNLGKDTIICEGVIILDAGNPGATYLWQNESTNQTFTASTYGNYHVTVEINNCETTDQINLLPCSAELWVPNVFTPNEDGINDDFGAKGIEITGLKMYIYNRWGERVFESNNISNWWNGTYNGKQCPDGVYSWLIFYTDSEGKEYSKCGIVTLIK